MLCRSPAFRHLHDFVRHIQICSRIHQRPARLWTANHGSMAHHTSIHAWHPARVENPQRLNTKHCFLNDMKKKVMAVLVLLLLIACAEEAPRPKPGPIIPEIEITKPQAQPLPQRPEYEPPPTYPFETGNLVEIAMIAKD